MGVYLPSNFETREFDLDGHFRTGNPLVVVTYWADFALRRMDDEVILDENELNSLRNLTETLDMLDWIDFHAECWTGAGSAPIWDRIRAQAQEVLQSWGLPGGWPNSPWDDSNSNYALRHPVRVEPDPPIPRELHLEGRVPPRPIVLTTP